MWAESTTRGALDGGPMSNVQNKNKNDINLLTMSHVALEMF